MLKLKNLIFIGAPGAGKGTFSAVLQEKYNLAHISTGDILREQVKQDTQLGREAAKIMSSGGLVPDEIVVMMVKDRLAQDDCKNGFILDGFPRTIAQAEMLDKVLAGLNLTLDKVVYFKVDDNILIDRLTARQSCKQCGAIYNKIFMPPKKENICDNCNVELFQRADDTIETVKSRLNVFYEQTSPLINFYSSRGELFEITETDKEAIKNILETELR